MCQTAGAHPGDGIFVLIREGFVSWLVRDDDAPSAYPYPERRPAGEHDCNELINLLATIAIDKGVQTNGV